MQSFCRFALFPLLILSAPSLFAQGTGSITGTVEIIRGGSPKADVTLTNTGTRNATENHHQRGWVNTFSPHPARNL